MNATPVVAVTGAASSTSRTHGELPLRAEALAVRDALVARGLESPFSEPDGRAAEQRHRIQLHFAEIMKVLGLDLTDDSLAETPRRVAKMYVDEVFSGLDYRRFPHLTVVANKARCDEMIRVDDIAVSSTCEHHFVAIDGTATVAYIPKNHLIGLSKINRIVGFFARRPQIQERLTQQVLVALQTLLGTDDVAVSIRATHFCVRARGIMDANSKTTTTSLGGVFKSRGDTRREFLLGLERS